jgi:uncharacterized radical SAM superfamily Fe-S cluster-containing enzyme
MSPGKLFSLLTSDFRKAKRFAQLGAGSTSQILRAQCSTTGFPRETDSLCPTCVKEVRNAVITGAVSLETLMNEHPGEIKAQIVEDNGQVVMRKIVRSTGSSKT